jgi:4-amino-4-deoxy-L-arabinose transferase-like glycosyltransferase
MPTLFWRLLGVYTALWTLIPWLANTSFPLDVAEGLAWGQNWQWGYYKHPPLPAWLLHLAYESAGAFGVYALAALNGAGALACVYGVLRQLNVRQHGAALAAALLWLVYYYSWPTPEFNHNTLQLLLWPLNMLLFLRALRQPRWCIAWAAAAAALLYTKYSGIILLVLLFGYTAWRGKHLWRSEWLYAAMLLGVLLMTPHLMWLQQNAWAPFSYVAQRSESGWPWSFIGAQVLNHAVLLLLWPLLPRVQRFSPTQRHFIVFFALAPVILTAAMAIVLQQSPRSMWGMPMFSLSGALLLCYPLPKLARRWRRSFIPLLSVLVIMPPIMYGVTSTQKKSKRVSLPAVVLAEHVLTQWQQRTACPLKIVAGTIETAGVIAHALNPRPQVWINNNFNHAPWLAPEHITQYGYVQINAQYGVEAIIVPATDCAATPAK